MPPAQIVAADAEAETVGAVFTVTATVAVFVQPVEVFVPVTVYVVVEVGVATTLDPVLAFNVAVGDQEYVLAPEAVRVEVLPAQIVVGDAEEETVGAAFTVTATVEVFEHPVEVLVPITV